MTTRDGVMVFGICDWRIWIDHQSYETFEGMNVELIIRDLHYKGQLKEDGEWCIITKDNINVSLMYTETYHVRMNPIELVPISCP